MARGFLIGATAGRTTLTGEGLQHADGHSPLLAATNPAVVSYDPAFAFEIGHIMEDGLRRMFGDEEKQIDFQFHIPVHITYQTAFVDDAGKLQFRDDVYGLDSKIESLLKGSERALADAVMERPLDPNFKPSPVDLQRIQNAARSPNPLAVPRNMSRPAVMVTLPPALTAV